MRGPVCEVLRRAPRLARRERAGYQSDRSRQGSKSATLRSIAPLSRSGHVGKKNRSENTAGECSRERVMAPSGSSKTHGRFGDWEIDKAGPPSLAPPPAEPALLLRRKPPYCVPFSGMSVISV